MEYKGINFEWVGHATVRIEKDKVVYIDPWKGVVDEERKDGDLVLVSHSDYGHYDPDAIKRVARKDASVVVYEKVGTRGTDFETIEIGYKDTISAEGIYVESLAAHNEEDGPHTAVSGQPYHPEEQVVGFLLDMDGTRIYFAGDTDFLDQHREVDADVFLPPIGGVYTMNADEAADFARAIEPELVLPVHYNHPQFPELSADAEKFKQELQQDGIEAEIEF